VRPVLAAELEARAAARNSALRSPPRDRPTARHTMGKAETFSAPLAGTFFLAGTVGRAARESFLTEEIMVGRRAGGGVPGVLARGGESSTATNDRGSRMPTPRVAFSIAETAAMLGKNPVALRRECERKARREGDRVVAHLALGIRAHKHDGRWFVTVPRELLG
jgi:hypothetical protein